MNNANVTEDRDRLRASSNRTHLDDAKGRSDVLDALMGEDPKRHTDLESKRVELEEHDERHPTLATKPESHGPIAVFSLLAVIAAYGLDVVLLREPIDFFVTLFLDAATAQYMVWVVPFFIITLELFVGYMRGFDKGWRVLAIAAALGVPSALVITFWVVQDEFLRPYLVPFGIFALLAHVVVIYGAQGFIRALIELGHRLARRNLESAVGESAAEVENIHTRIKIAHLDWDLSVSSLPVEQQLPFREHMERSQNKGVLDHVLGRLETPPPASPPPPGGPSGGGGPIPDGSEAASLRTPEPAITGLDGNHHN